MNDVEKIAVKCFENNVKQKLDRIPYRQLNVDAGEIVVEHLEEVSRCMRKSCKPSTIVNLEHVMDEIIDHYMRGRQVDELDEFDGNTGHVIASIVDILSKKLPSVNVVKMRFGEFEADNYEMNIEEVEKSPIFGGLKLQFKRKHANLVKNAYISKVLKCMAVAAAGEMHEMVNFVETLKNVKKMKNRISLRRARASRKNKRSSRRRIAFV